MTPSGARGSPHRLWRGSDRRSRRSRRSEGATPTRRRSHHRTSRLSRPDRHPARGVTVPTALFARCHDGDLTTLSAPSETSVGSIPRSGDRRRERADETALGGEPMKGSSHRRLSSPTNSRPPRSTSVTGPLATGSPDRSRSKGEPMTGFSHGRLSFPPVPTSCSTPDPSLRGPTRGRGPSRGSPKRSEGRPPTEGRGSPSAAVAALLRGGSYLPCHSAGRFVVSHVGVRFGGTHRDGPCSFPLRDYLSR